MWASADQQTDLQPLTVSHGSKDGFVSSFIWDGNRDYSGILSLLTLIQLWKAWGGKCARTHMRTMAMDRALWLAGAWDTDLLAPSDMFAVSLSAPSGRLDIVHLSLYIIVLT